MRQESLQQRNTSKQFISGKEKFRSCRADGEFFFLEVMSGPVCQHIEVFKAFRLDSGNRRSRNSSNDPRFSSRQYWPARTSHRYRPSSTKRVSFSASLRCSQARISSILVSTNWARRRLSLGSTGGFLVMKLVKPIKAFRSWPPDEGGLGQLLASETKPDVRTAAAGVLGKTDAAVGQELGGL